MSGPDNERKPSSGPSVAENVGSSSMEVLIAEKERSKEAKYLKLYTDLYHRHRDVLFRMPVDEQERQDFQEESKILSAGLQVQRNAWLIGASVGVATFVSLRVLPRYMVWRIGGNARVKAYQEKLTQSKKQRFSVLQSAMGLMMEGSFSLWAGHRGYQVVLDDNTNLYDDMASIPLCSGRSAVAESLCDDWMELTQRQVPQSFWANLESEGSLKDEDTWRAIRKFSENCAKRRSFEHVIRAQRGITGDHKVPVLLPRKVLESIDSAAEERGTTPRS